MREEAGLITLGALALGGFILWRADVNNWWMVWPLLLSVRYSIRF